MIFLYEESEQEFDTLGIGLLKDALSCNVKEELNGSFELEMIYPINGSHYKDISLRSIIYTKPNKYDNPQPFRIYNITKPKDGKVTINAEHISYDLSGYSVSPFDEEATGITETLNTIRSKILFNDTFPFIFTTNIENEESKFNIQIPASVRSVLAGREGSLLDIFKCEYKFDKYEIKLLKSRGEDRGFSIRYGKNLNDIKQELKSEKLYTHVYPYYYRIITDTDTTTNYEYQSMYIRTAGEGEEPIEPFSKDWLTIYSDNKPWTPIVKDIPIQVVTEGEYKNKIYIWTDVTDPDDGSVITKYVEVNSEQYPPNIPNPSSNIKESTEMTTLENYIVPIEGRESIIPKRILSLDLTNYFSEKPTQQELEDKAKEYIKTNKLGEIVETLEASFYKINDNSINESICLLGDTVTVYFKALNVNSTLRIISTTYDVLADRYSEIGLGKKESTLSDNALSVGDDVSSLNNDANYTDEIKVGEIIAKTITADFIQSKDADFTHAQITKLHSDDIFVSGIIEAAEGSIDTLISELLVTDNAKIRNQLIVGDNLVVNGEINIKSGTISIVKDDNIDFIIGYIDKDEDSDPNKQFKSKWLKTTYNGTVSIEPESGKIYKVYDIYNVWSQYYYEWDSDQQMYEQKIITPDICFEVDKDGNLTANSADIKGKITATSGDIGGCVINGTPELYTEAYIIEGSERYSRNWLTDVEGSTNPLTPVNNNYYKVIEDDIVYYYIWSYSKYEDIKVGILQVDGANISNINADDITSGTISGINIKIGDIDPITNRAPFEVDSDGDVYINKGSIQLGENDPVTNRAPFEVDEDGNLTSTSADIKGKITATSGDIGGCIINGIPELYTEAYIIEGSDRYSSNWLTDVEGSTEPLIPVANNYYKVIEDYITYYYIWSYSRYEDIKAGILQVDGANISNINADDITSGTISGINIKIGDIDPVTNRAPFEVDSDGEVTASSIHLENGIIETASGKLKGITEIETTNITISNDFYCDKINVGSSIQLGSITIDDSSNYDLIEKSVNIFIVLCIEDNTTTIEPYNNYLNKFSVSWIVTMPDVKVAFANPSSTHNSTWLKKNQNGTETLDTSSAEYFLVYSYDGVFLGNYIWNSDDLVYNKIENNLPHGYVYPNTQENIINILAANNNAYSNYKLLLHFENTSIINHYSLPKGSVYGSVLTQVDKTHIGGIHKDYFTSMSSRKLVSIQMDPNFYSYGGYVNTSTLIYNDVASYNLELNNTFIIADGMKINKLSSNSTDNILINSHFYVHIPGNGYYRDGDIKFPLIFATTKTLTQKYIKMTDKDDGRWWYVIRYEDVFDISGSNFSFGDYTVVSVTANPYQANTDHFPTEYNDLKVWWGRGQEYPSGSIYDGIFIFNEDDEINTYCLTIALVKND